MTKAWGIKLEELASREQRTPPPDLEEVKCPARYVAGSECEREKSKACLEDPQRIGHREISNGIRSVLSLPRCLPYVWTDAAQDEIRFPLVRSTFAEIIAVRKVHYLIALSIQLRNSLLKHPVRVVGISNHILGMHPLQLVCTDGDAV